MLNSFRQTAPLLAGLICMALLAMWLTGAHGHRHVGGDSHQHALAGSAADHAHADHPHDAGHDESSPAYDHFAPHPLSLIHGDGHENIEVNGLQPSLGKVLSDLPLLVLLCCAVLVLTRTRTQVVTVFTDPPDPKRSDGSLRPPLRGPPSFSVA